MTEKSFPALRACVDLLSYNDNDLVRDARAELTAMDELLAAAIIILNGQPTPRFSAAIAACLPKGANDVL